MLYFMQIASWEIGYDISCKVSKALTFHANSLLGNRLWHFVRIVSETDNLHENVEAYFLEIIFQNSVELFTQHVKCYNLGYDEGVKIYNDTSSIFDYICLLGDINNLPYST